MGGKRNVVEPDDGDIGRHTAPGLGKRIDGADGDHIGSGEDGIEMPIVGE